MGSKIGLVLALSLLFYWSAYSHPIEKVGETAPLNKPTEEVKPEQETLETIPTLVDAAINVIKKEEVPTVVVVEEKPNKVELVANPENNEEKDTSKCGIPGWEWMCPPPPPPPPPPTVVVVPPPASVPPPPPVVAICSNGGSSSASSSAAAAAAAASSSGSGSSSAAAAAAAAASSSSTAIANCSPGVPAPAPAPAPAGDVEYWDFVYREPEGETGLKAVDKTQPETPKESESEDSDSEESAEEDEALPLPSPQDDAEPLPSPKALQTGKVETLEEKKSPTLFERITAPWNSWRKRVNMK